MICYSPCTHCLEVLSLFVDDIPAPYLQYPFFVLVK